MRIYSGTDITDLKRIAKSITSSGDAFVLKCFTEDEISYCRSLKESRMIESFGARFAAKEAASKALGTGIMTGGISLTDFEITRDDRGCPHLVLHGAAKQRADQLGITDMSVSLSHDGGYTVAYVCMLAEEK